MSNSVKEKLVIVGGSLSIAALVCGIGLLSKAPVTGAVPEHSQESVQAEDQKAAHGNSTAEGAKSGSPKESGKAAAEPASKHGAAAKETHGADAANETTAGHGTDSAESADTKKPKVAEVPLDPEVWRAKGDSAVACGRYDDAIRYYTLGMKNVPQEKKAEYELRLADATQLSPSLPAQLRAQKALESYSRILTENPKSSVSGEAQYQVGVCLAVQNRWQEALEAFDRYEKNHPFGAHSEEVRYRRAEGLSTMGNPDQAAEILEQLVQEERDAERKSRAILLLARVKLQMVRTDSYVPPQGLPETHREEIEARPPEVGVSKVGEAQDHAMSSDAPALAVRPGINVPAPKSVPETQWAGISRCVESGNLREAQRLLRPYVENAGDPSQSALVWTHWAHLLKAAAERGSLDARMDGIVISSRAE